jgi:hypothetical protein
MDANIVQLKADIDRGMTGDRVSLIDPGIAPLGTDDEAAGWPPDPEAVTLARIFERGRMDRIQASNGREMRCRAWLVVTALVILLAAVAGLAILSVSR